MAPDSLQLRHPRGDLERAELLYQYAILRDVRCWQAVYNLGIVLFRKRRLGPAERCFRHVLKVRRNTHYRSFNMLGIVQYSRGDLPQALESFLRAARVNPYYPQTWNNIGLVYRDMGREDLAREACHRHSETANAIPFSPGRGADIAESTVIEFEAMIGQETKTA